MKAPTGKLALAYRSLAVAEEKAQRLMAERDALQELLNERDAEIDRLTALSVSHILLRVEPGPEGMGVEVYADSVAQVIEALDSACNWVEVLQGQIEDLGGYHAIQGGAPKP